ncbi:MAG: hypothetical protein AAF664_09010 [Planctomycetota bacterium]
MSNKTMRSLYALIAVLWYLVTIGADQSKAEIVTWSIVGEIGAANAPGILGTGEIMTATFTFDSTKIPSPSVSVSNGSRYRFTQGIDGASFSMSDGSQIDQLRNGDNFTVQIRGEDNNFIRGELRFFNMNFQTSDYSRMTVAFGAAATPFPDGNLVTSNLTVPTVNRRDSPGGSAALIIFASTGSGTFYNPGTFTSSTPVPEPNTLASLAVFGLVSTCVRRRRLR